MNHHGSAVILGDRGVLIRGRAGAGKTTLALSLVETCRATGGFARLVSDRVYVLEKGQIQWQGSMAELDANAAVQKAYLTV